MQTDVSIGGNAPPIKFYKNKTERRNPTPEYDDDNRNRTLTLLVYTITRIEITKCIN